LAPAIALLTGIPFPRNIRAVEDRLDDAFSVADGGTLPEAYLRDRKHAIERFRVENRAALQSWLGPGASPTWSAFYARERRAQHLRLGLGLALCAAALWLSLRRRRFGLRHALRFGAWIALVVAGTALSYALVRKSLDFTSINARWEFISQALLVCLTVALLGQLAHRPVVGVPQAGRGDQLTLVLLAAASVGVHILAYGWPLGFPLPGHGLLFFPFLAPIFVVAHALVAAVLTGWSLLRPAPS
jgi:hypothetical protein